MIVIGEKINGTRQEVGKAVASRDAGFIEGIARLQAEAGATYLDVNAGTGKSEPEDLVWLVRTVQAAVDIPLCVDSANAAALRAALPLCTRTPLVNSISGERARLDGVLPVVAELGCPVVALAADDAGIAKDAEARLAVIERVLAETRAAGVDDERVYVDPLVLPLAGLATSGAVTLEVMRTVKERFPQVRLCLGLSNVSYGLPARGLLNRVFLAFAVEAGLDAALLDPTDTSLMQELLAAELVLDSDPYCRRFTQAYRKGAHGFPPPAAKVDATASG